MQKYEFYLERKNISQQLFHNFLQNTSNSLKLSYQTWILLTNSRNRNRANDNWLHTLSVSADLQSVPYSYLILNHK